MADLFNVKINSLKLFFNKKNYYGMSRKNYLDFLIKNNPDDFKTFIINEYGDEIKVYTTWYILLLVISSIFIIMSIFIYSYWYIFLFLSIIHLIISKKIKNKLGKMLSGLKYVISFTDIAIKKQKI